MNVIETPLEGLYVVVPKVFQDGRGHFFESYNESRYFAKGIKAQFVQGNQSVSSHGALRGLHFQKGDSAQAKLVRVVDGLILDIAVDLRPDSKSFGDHFSVELSAENNKQLFIPRGFAHGFIVLSERATFSYMCDNYYDPASEDGIIFSDPELKIDWRLSDQAIILSDKDKNLNTFKEFKASLS